MNNIDTFLKVFGAFSVADAVQIVLAIAFLIYLVKNHNKNLIKKHDAEAVKEEQLHEAWDNVQKYPKYREQSRKIQEELKRDIQGIRKIQEECMARLETMEENMKRRERNKLRDRLLQNYRYFTSKDKNPQQSWTRMEAESFWEIFKDYEEADGDGYVHTVVQPAMNLLEVIEMTDTARIAELMRSRGQQEV